MNFFKIFKKYKINIKKWRKYVKNVLLNLTFMYKKGKITISTGNERIDCDA